MSKFIKRHEEIAQARCQARRAARVGSSVGFTEAELEAAQWAKKLPEVQMQICRRTNGDLRHTRLKGIMATSRRSSVAKQTAAVDLDEVLTEPLEKAKVRERRGERKQKKERKEKHQRKKGKHGKNEKNEKRENEKNCAEVTLPKAPQEERSEVESNKKGEDEGRKLATNKMHAALVSNEVETAKLFMYDEIVDHVIADKEQSSKVHTKGKENLEKEKTERKERKRERRREKKEKKERKDRKERKGRERAKEKKERPERPERETRFDECVRLETRNKEATIPEPGSLEAKAMEMKMQRKLARQMRREQRQFKREEHERLRREMAEADGWQDAIGQLIEAAQAQSQEDIAAKAARAAVIDVDADAVDGAPSPVRNPQPCRSLEELVKELDELERLKKEAKKGKKAKTEAQGAADAAGAASSAALEGAEGEHPEGAEGEATAQGGAEGNAQPQPVPNDPLNPLNAAYDMKAYALLRKLRLDEEHQISQIALDEPDWDHLGYLRRSPSPCRLRTKGAMWPTRKGAWRSRAGGVFLPPEANVERQGSPSLSPARWMYPEEFNRPLQKARRSPSYTRMEREEISSSSSSDSSSSSTIPRKRRKASKASSSRASRPSPTYDLEPDD